MNHFAILAAAKAVPEKVVSNEALTKLMPTSDEWIRQRTGIATRHVATTETTTSLCTEVAKSLLAKTGRDADQLDLIVVATMSADYHTPSVAASVQGQIKATNATAFDLNAACSGFVYGLNLFEQLMQTGAYQNGLLIGGEVLSRLVDWHDRRTAVLFGDGAAGVWLSRDPAQQGQVLGRDLRTLGELGHYLTAGQMPAQPVFNSAKTENSPFFKMNGRRVYEFAVKNVPLSIARACEQAGLRPDQIDHFVLHQANARIITSVAEKMGLPLARFPMNIDRYGNTAAASEPILLAELIANQQIKRGDVLALSGFGGGLTIGTVIISY